VVHPITKAKIDIIPTGTIFFLISIIDAILRLSDLEELSFITPKISFIKFKLNYNIRKINIPFFRILWAGHQLFMKS
jgi:hypothetical protein